MENDESLHGVYELIRRIGENDQEAVEEFCNRFWKSIQTKIFYDVNDLYVAEDLTQEVFIRVIEYADTVDPPDPEESQTKRDRRAKAWVNAITNNLVKNYYAKRAKRRSNESNFSSLTKEDQNIEDLGIPALSVEFITTFESRSCLEIVKKSLTSRAFRILCLRAEGYTYEEIGEMMDRSPQRIWQIVQDMKRIVTKALAL